MLSVTLTGATLNSATFFLFSFFRILHFLTQDGGVGAEDLAMHDFAEADTLSAAAGTT